MTSSGAAREVSVPYATLSDAGRKARYGLAYLRSICSQAGVGMTENSPDEDVLAVDCKVEFNEADVRVQVKCTSQWQLAGRSMSIPVEPDWIRKWDKNLFPVYLVVVIVSEPPSGWLRHDHDGTFHATAGFWTRLRTTEIGRSINVPKGQRLSTDSIAEWHADLLACVSPRAEQ